MKIRLTYFSIALIALTVTVEFVSAQVPIKPKNQKQQNFYDIQKSKESYYKNQETKSDLENADKEDEQDNGWEIYKRWENFMEPRIYPSGELNYTKNILQTSEQIKISLEKSQTQTGESWQPLGPTNVPAGDGIGRVNWITVDPTDTNIIWVGTPAGGLWKSIDNGQTWSSNTDLLPVLGVSQIAIDPFDHNNMLIGMGDRDAGDTQSIGIMRSIDGGVTWTLTSLNYNITNYAQIRKIIYDPTIADIVIASTSTGIYRSTDGGINWDQTGGGDIRDLEFNPADHNTIYACSNDQVFVSPDNGLNWNQSTNGLPTSGVGRMELAVTNSASSTVYLLCDDANNSGYFGLYRSTNSGIDWTLMSNSPNLFGWAADGSDVGGQGWYTLSLAADQDSSNIVYVGGVNIWKSNDGGTNWNIVAHWTGANGTPYVHADIHHLLSTSNGEVFCGCDGGFYRTYNRGASWEDYSNGLQISQYYRLGCSATNAGIVYLGAQDNGTSKYNNGNWSNVLGADGMEALVDYIDENIVYGSSQNGGLYKSIDGGQNYNDITPSGGGAWVTPYIISPQDHNNLIYGGAEINESFNGGATWNTVTSGLSGGNNFQSLATCKTNSNVIYAATGNKIFKTIDHGLSWTNVTANLPVSFASITYIAVKDSDANRVWVTFSGFSNVNKVFETTDGGLQWENISNGIPNLPVNCIVYQNNSADAIYIGTDIGVYYKDNFMSNWVAVNNGLPNVIVDELEIQYGSGKLRAATFGRGLWETNLVTPVFYDNDIAVKPIEIPKGFICDSTVTPVITLKNYGTNTVTSAVINYQVDNGNVSQINFSGNIPSLGTQLFTMPLLVATGGAHTYKVFTSMPNNVADNFPANDTAISYYTKTYTDTLPLTEDFEVAAFPPGNWINENLDNWIGWSQATVTGSEGVNTQCAFVDLYYYTSVGQRDDLYSPELDFTGLDTVTLTFELAYARYPGYVDSLFVKISNDCTDSWEVVYAKTDSSLVTAPDNTNPYSPVSGDEWREETINLNAFAGQPSNIITFETWDGYGNRLFIDNINIHGKAIPDTVVNSAISKNNQSSSINCFPNPTSGLLQLNYQSQQDRSVTVTIIDVLERPQIEITLAIHQGNNSFNFDLSKFSAGVYFIKTDDGNNFNSMKVVKF